MRRIKENSGISLIALVVTIIILIILAGVTISLVGGDGFLFKAQVASDQYKQAEEKEIEDMKETSDYLDEITGELKKRLNVSAYPYNGIYDGEGHGIIVKCQQADAKITYSENGLTYDSENSPLYVDVGTYTVYYKVTLKDYLTESGSLTVTINKASQGGLILSENSGTYTYPESRTFTVVSNVAGTIRAISSDENVVKVSVDGNTIRVIPQAIEQTTETAIIRVISEATTNYNEQEASYEATVTKGRLSVTSEPYTGIYDGQPHGITVVCENQGAHITYSEDGLNYNLNTSPTYTTVGNRTVYYKVEAPGYLTESGSVTSTISKAQTDFTLSATSGTYTYPVAGTFSVTNNVSGGIITASSSNENIAKVTVSGDTITVIPQSTMPQASQKVTITITSAGTQNYETKEATYEATINKGTLHVTATPYRGTYDNANHTATVTCEEQGAIIKYSENGTSYNLDTCPNYSADGTHTVYYKVELAGYITESGSVTITIDKPKVTYNANGGINAPNEQSFSPGSAITIPSDKPTKTNYFFAGWSTSSTATTASYFEGKTYSFSGNTTLYAVWSTKLYLYKDGNEYSDITGGWTFSAWEMNGFGEKLSNSLHLGCIKKGNSGGVFTTNNKLSPGNYNLYIKYKKENSSETEFWAGLYYKFESEKRVVVNTYKNGTYEEAFKVNIKDWSTLSIGNWDPDDYIYEVYITHDGVYNVPERVNIIYDKNGGVDKYLSAAREEVEVENQSALKNEKVHLNKREMYKDGYIFIGYSEDPNATVATYYADQDNCYFTKDTTLYGVYVKSFTMYDNGTQYCPIEINEGDYGKIQKNSTYYYMYNTQNGSCWCQLNFKELSIRNGTYTVNVYYRTVGTTNNSYPWDRLALIYTEPKENKEDEQYTRVPSVYASTGYHNENFTFTINTTVNRPQFGLLIENTNCANYIYKVTITAQ